MRLPAASSSFVLFVSAGVPLATAAGPPLTDHSSCGCYLTNGTESRFFSHHAFFDFRSQSQYAGVPPVIASSKDSSAAPLTSKYFSSEDWTNMWIMGNWNNSKSQRKDATVFMTNSPNNVYIEASDDKSSSPQTWLTLRTQRLADFQTAAEIESKVTNQFLSVRMLARTIGAKGAITALFTYKHSEKLAEVQESDLEVRTSDADDIIHYTNQPAYTDDGNTNTLATTNVSLPDGLKWTDWAVHRLDWTPERNTWYINGKQVAQIAFQTPRDSSKVILNAWSDGGQWAGNMSVTDAAYLQVQWFEIVYNSTESVKHGHKRRADGGLHVEDFGAQSPQLRRRADAPAQGCKAVCSIDESPKQGQPVMLWNNAATRIIERSGLAGWIPVLVLGMFAWR